MDTKEYVKSVVKRESANFQAIHARLGDPTAIRMLHAAIGMCTETGEIQDQLKKHLFYGKPLDKTNLVEELGDLFWYLGVMSDALGVSFEEIMAKNDAKLEARYGNKFTEQAALNRNLEAERKTLE